MIDEDAKQVTQIDVAQKAGVSRSVVSYVINNGPRVVSNETRTRVLEAIAELNYRPNKHAQRLIQEKWNSVAEKQIGIIMSHGSLFERPYYGAILAGIQEAAHARHHHIRFIRVFESLKDPILLNQLIHKHEISGLILLSLNQTLESENDYGLLKHVLGRIQNVVCVDWEYENLASVNFDRFAAANSATHHLLTLGHQRVAYIGPCDQRVAGYEAAMSEQGLSTFSLISKGSAETGYDQASLCNMMHYSAIVAGTDEVAFGILKFCKEKALDVPRTIALVSIDNIALSAFAQPSLTTVAVPQKGIGERAVDMLIENKRGTNKANKQIMLPIELVIRESCGLSLSSTKTAALDEQKQLKFR